MDSSRRWLLRWQFELAWSLFDRHLRRLEPEDFLWRPASWCWTVHRCEDGAWRPDFAETEPEPVPVPTVGWLTWHLDWWWGTALDHLRGRTPRVRDEVVWPGDGEAAVTGLRGLRTDWLAALDALTEADLDGPAPFPWPPGSGHTVAHTVGWVNAELMKNAAEIGQLHMLRAASAHTP